MSPIEVHFDTLMPEEEQARIGATLDLPENMRVMRALAAYSELQEENAELRAYVRRLWRSSIHPLPAPTTALRLRIEKGD